MEVLKVKHNLVMEIESLEKELEEKLLIISVLDSYICDEDRARIKHEILEGLK